MRTGTLEDIRFSFAIVLDRRFGPLRPQDALP